MTDIARLVIKADSTDIIKSEKELKKFNKTSGKTDKATGKMNKGFASMSATLKKLAPLAAAAAASYAAFQMVRVARETEMYVARLKTMTGSLDAANDAFDRLNQFARTTPFTLQQSIDSFVKLKALGLDPSERAMTSYGNTAAAMGKSLNQMIEAVADASTNEFERLKEFGIKAKQQGDDVTFTFQGISTTVKKNSEEIQQYLLNIGETQFAGAMSDQMNTIEGQLSNLEMSFDDLWRVMGNGLGVTDAVKSVLASVSSVIVSLKNELTDLFNAIDLNKYAELIEKQNTAQIAIDEYQKASIAGNEAYKNSMRATYVEAVKTLEQVNPAIEALAIKLGFIKPKAEEAAASVDGVTGAVGGLGSALAKTSEEVDVMSRALDLISAEFDKLDQVEALEFAGLNNIEESADGINKVGDSLAKVNETISNPSDIVDWSKTAERAVGGVTGAFVDMALTGKASFSDFAQSFMINIAKMIMQAYVLKALQGAAGSGGLFGLFPSAQGNSFNGGNIVPMAKGGLITEPTLFPMAQGGIALGGELDTEVIMPIGRTSNGDMGVKADIKGGGTVVNINNYSQAKATTRTTQNADGSKTIDVLIKEQVNAAIQSGGLDKNMAKIYGNRRVGY